MSHFIYWGGGNTKGENSKIRYGEEADFILPSSDWENVFYKVLSVHSFELRISKRLRCIYEGIVL